MTDLGARFLFLSVLVHGALGLALYRFAQAPQQISAADPEGFDAFRVKQVLEKMRGATEPPPISTAPDPWISAPPPPTEVQVTDRSDDLPLRGRPSLPTTEGLAPSNLNEILDRPFAAWEGGPTATPSQRPSRGDPSDLEQAWREAGGLKPAGTATGETAGGDGSGAAQGPPRVLSGGFAVGGEGEVSRSAVEKALAACLPTLQRCYQDALKAAPDLEGKVLLRWLVSDSGAVSEVEVERSQLDDEPLHQCIIGAVAKARFPPPNGGAILIRYPLTFTRRER